MILTLNVCELQHNHRDKHKHAHEYTVDWSLRPIQTHNVNILSFE